MSNRVDMYLGPQKEILKPSELSRFEDGNWIASRKIDGCHGILSTNNSGYISKVISRTGNSFPEAKELIGLFTGLSDTTLIGEYEVTTQAAIKAFEKNGFRRFWAFDITVVQGTDIRALPIEQRRILLQKAVEAIQSQSKGCYKLIEIVDERTKGFASFYKEVKAQGGEGLVLKKKGSLYRSQTSDGRTSNWVRVKDVAPVDLYVMGTGFTPSRAVNLRVGVWKNGKLVELQSLAVPKGHTAHQLLDKVIECEYDTQTESGKYRHLRFVRVRPDKTKEMCTTT